MNTANSQMTTLKGKVIDANTGETLIGAIIIYGKGQGTTSDLEGNFQFTLPSGNRSITVSYVGYEKKSSNIEAKGKLISIDFVLKPIELSEVHIVSDVAIDRETPVAFSNVSLQKVNEELAAQDIPMILNSTPGVYATQSGGGDGDARITIRGFNQRNVAVMIDGIPVNDMENGWVYWSNWSGLDAVTSKIQVQRGLGASKIAIPSVGGTMNIITKGIGNKQGGSFKQDLGSFGRIKTSISYNSGRLKNGWGLTVAGSYKKGNGFVDETCTEGYFYYGKLEKRLSNHTFTLSIMGAPQQHGQRGYKSNIYAYDTSYANALGINNEINYNNIEILNRGIHYNKHWGYLDRWTISNNGDTLHARETLNTRKNYFHKPQYSLRHFWKIYDNLYISNIGYISIGNGGGTGISGNTNNYDSFGQYNLQEAYNGNKNNIDALYSSTLSKSTTYLRSSRNNHYWYGGLSTINYKPNEETSISGGIDLRQYKGEHYREVYDLLGGDYIIDESNGVQLTQVKNIGDIVGYHNDSYVKWAGSFGQIEYNNEKISSFINLSGSYSGYRRHDHFKKKDLVLEDTTFFEALGTSVSTEVELDEDGNIIGAYKTMSIDTITYNGKKYTMYSDEAKEAMTEWEWIKGYTIKTGANYNIDYSNNIFFNVGYISKAPRFNNIFDYNNQLYREIKNEEVKAIEGGYSYRSRSLSGNCNLYYTIWENKPSNGGIIIEVDDVPYRANINGMNALHKGLEIDVSYKASNNLQIEGLVSLGNWQWTSADTVKFYDDDNNPVIDEFGNEIIAAFDAEGVHVGDAAQTQYAISFRYEPNSKSYIKFRSTYFDNYYSDFDPLSLNGDNAGRESWKIPAYNLIDLHAGYKINITEKHNLDLKISVLNILNSTYISDAQNNDPYNASYQDFDAKSAGVFFGLGRRFNISAKINF